VLVCYMTVAVSSAFSLSHLLLTSIWIHSQFIAGIHTVPL